MIGAAAGYGIQVYNNYQSGLTGSSAWTSNISGEEIVGGALIGAGVVIFAPVAVAAAGNLLVGAGVATSTAGLVAAGNSAYGFSGTLSNFIYGSPYSNLPTLEIDSSKMPNIADNIRNAQSNGAPNILTRTENQALIDANRRGATKLFSGAGSPDEYPFASTYEGGAGAFVKGVPLKEQLIQGGTMSRFYNMFGIGEGDKFEVLVR